MFQHETDSGKDDEHDDEANGGERGAAPTATLKVSVLPPGKNCKVRNGGRKSECLVAMQVMVKSRL
jgi:hypothetical protein